MVSYPDLDHYDVGSRRDDLLRGYPSRGRLCVNQSQRDLLSARNVFRGCCDVSWRSSRVPYIETSAGCKVSPESLRLGACRNKCDVGFLFFFSSRRRHTSSVSAFLLNRSSDLHSFPSECHADYFDFERIEAL